MAGFANLKVNMLFDPAKVWQHTSQFEKAYSDFLNSIGLQGETVKTIGGATGEMFYLIKPKEGLPMPEQTDKLPEMKSPQQKLKEMATKPEKKK